MFLFYALYVSVLWFYTFYETLNYFIFRQGRKS